MTKNSKDHNYADDAPLTATELKTARRLHDCDTALIAAIKKSRGRPAGRRKESVHLSLDADLVEAMRQTGRGWQTRANALLRKGLKLSPAPNNHGAAN